MPAIKSAGSTPAPVVKSTGSALVATVSAVLLLTGCSDPPPPSAEAPAPSAPSAKTAPVPRTGPSGQAGPQRQTPAAHHLPGLGPRFRALVPGGTHQALVVTGVTEDSNTATAVLYEREKGRPWRTVAGPWPAHNGVRGWTNDHWAGDLRTPIGVYGLGDAGGREPDPGTKLPYDHDEQFSASGTGFLGEPLEGSFDYVVAIDYNRVPGTSPLDQQRPQGPEKGNGVWIHVDHEGPTQACISLTRDRMRELLRALDPDKHPVIVMGPAPELRK